MLTLFTNRYQAFRSDQGVPVRITRGAPRFKLPYELAYSVRELYPRGDYFSKPQSVFTTAYCTHLDELGSPRIAACLTKISQEAGDHRLVLLCFEDLSDSATWCHRRIFAAWWRRVTGDDVRELSPMAEQFEQEVL